MSRNLAVGQRDILFFFNKESGFAYFGGWQVYFNYFFHDLDI